MLGAGEITVLFSVTYKDIYVTVKKYSASNDSCGSGVIDSNNMEQPSEYPIHIQCRKILRSLK